MITLCGSPISNYYNKVKLALLEKGVPFTEEFVPTKSTDPAVLAASPLAKIPFIRTPQGGLCESQVILEYIESAYPSPPLLPADPYAAAKVRELTLFIDLHLELVVRDLYPQAFFGGTVSDSNKARVQKQLQKNIAAFKQLARFAPYVAGDTFTQADCSAFANLPLLGMATKAVLGEDMLLAAGIDYKPYIKLVGERPAAQKVVADRKAAATRA
ncbi:MAG: glutathione S-transferase [Proteobacteria bacterium]|jgi:glutathione S-transferase|nr:glutathione S-transferase family protein [Ramlibacter sp.]MCA0215213.1 glutathione S-transferase [Pseudomonadota bacterium]